MITTKEMVDELSLRIYSYLDYKDNKNGFPAKWNREYARGYTAGSGELQRTRVCSYIAGMELFLEPDVYEKLCTCVDKALAMTYKQFMKKVNEWSREVDTLLQNASCCYWCNNADKLSA